jgi:hypothetical protein
MLVDLMVPQNTVGEVALPGLRLGPGWIAGWLRICHLFPATDPAGKGVGDIRPVLTAFPLIPSSKRMAALLFVLLRLIGVGFNGQSILYLIKYKSQQNFRRTKNLSQVRL